MGDLSLFGQESIAPCGASTSRRHRGSSHRTHRNSLRASFRKEVAPLEVLRDAAEGKLAYSAFAVG